MSCISNFSCEKAFFKKIVGTAPLNSLETSLYAMSFSRSFENALINKKDVIGLLPTGYGKSMCYLVPPLITKKTIFIDLMIFDIEESLVNFVSRTVVKDPMITPIGNSINLFA